MPWFENWGASDDKEPVGPDFVIDDVTVIFVALPGTGLLGLSTWNRNAAQATSRLLRENGAPAHTRPRRTRGFGELPEEVGGIGTRMLEAVKLVETDFVFYDPQQ